jgi:2-polyprenyl-3-methyl-5-hydroxy-6-metoxy-1,4-benzoquinol methylase
MLLDTERQTYEAMWAVDAYAAFSPGETYLPLFLDMVQTSHGTVLDAGCGSGKGALALQQAGFEVTACDLTPNGLIPAASGLRFHVVSLWHDLPPQLGYLFGRQVDYVYCCDVLEHIPLPFTMLVVRNLLAVARKGVFLTIALQPDQCGVWVGTALHQSVQSFVSWRDQLAELGTVQECRDCLMTGIYYVTPR